jgi:hypothetical protein
MYLGDDSSIPLLLRGGGAYNKPETATPYVAPKPAAIPLINQGGGVYNYPEIYAASTSGSYTPPARARKDANSLLLVAAAAGMWWALGVGGRGRSIW